MQETRVRQLMPPVDGVQEQYLSWKADILFYLPSRQIHYLRDAIANAMMRMRKMKDKGTLVVISGFSGAGKGTVSKALVEKFGYSLSVSATTRQPREGEQDGREYYFKSEDDFFLHCFPPNVVGWPRTTGKNHAALWHRVKIVSLVKGITPQQPFERQPAALHRAVLLDRLQGILRAGRRKPAPARQARGDILLVQADEPQAYPLHAVCPPRRPSFAASER